MRWGNLGREEAIFAVKVMDRLFGRRLFSVKRMIVVASLAIFICGSLILTTTFSNDEDNAHLYLENTWIFIVVCVLAFFSLAVSFSFTRFAAETVGKILTKVPLLNLVGILVILIFQYITFT